MKHLIYVTKAGRECFRNKSLSPSTLAFGQPEPHDIYGRMGHVNNNNLGPYGVHASYNQQGIYYQPPQMQKHIQTTKPLYYGSQMSLHQGNIHPGVQLQPSAQIMPGTQLPSGLQLSHQYDQQYNTVPHQQDFYNVPSNMSIVPPQPQDGQIPYGISPAQSAFKSVNDATVCVGQSNVFSPIVLNHGKHKGSMDNATSSTAFDGDAERKAKKLRDLKQQLRNNRPPLDLVNDLEGRESVTRVLSRMGDDGNVIGNFTTYEKFSYLNGRDRVSTPSGRSNSPHSNVLQSTFTSPLIHSPVIDIRQNDINSNPATTPVLPLNTASSYKLVPDTQGNFHLIPVVNVSTTPTQEGFCMNSNGAVSPSSVYSQHQQSLDTSDKHERRTPRYIKKQSNRRSRSRSEVTEKVNMIHEAIALHAESHSSVGESFHGQHFEDPLSAHMYRTTSRDNIHTSNSFHTLDSTFEHYGTNGNLSRVLSSDYINDLSVSKSFDIYGSKEHIPKPHHNTKLKRAKSGSSLDYRQGSLGVRAKEIALEGYHHKNYHRRLDGKPNIVASSLLSKSQPNIARDILDYDRSQSGPVICASPLLSPALGKYSFIISAEILKYMVYYLIVDELKIMLLLSCCLPIAPWIMGGVRYSRHTSTQFVLYLVDIVYAAFGR